MRITLSKENIQKRTELIALLYLSAAGKFHIIRRMNNIYSTSEIYEDRRLTPFPQ